MDIWQIDKLILFLLFFIPGFISTKVYNLLYPSEQKDFSAFLLEAIGYSSLNFAVLSWLIIIIHSGNFYNNHKVWYFICSFLILFIIPLLWPILFFKISNWEFVKKYIVSPIQKPWDYVFRKKEVFWVIIHLKDGRKIGGRYDRNSFSSSYPSKEQIYLEEVWKLDENGRFEEPITKSKGIIVLGEEILAIEFFE